MYHRVQRFLNGHYEEFLPEFLVLAVWLVAGLKLLGGRLWRF
jgi:hypothetical protein